MPTTGGQFTVENKRVTQTHSLYMQDAMPMHVSWSVTVGVTQLDNAGTLVKLDSARDEAKKKNNTIKNYI